MSTPSRLLFACLIPLALACGGKAHGSGGDDVPTGGSGAQGGGGSSNVGGSSRGGSGNTGGGMPHAGSSGSAGSAGSSGSAGASPECTEHDDEPGAYVPVSIINRTSTTLYLGPRISCSSDPGAETFFRVAVPEGPELKPVVGCRVSCANLRLQGTLGCPAICPSTRAVRLMPGEVHQTTWSALYDVASRIPTSCLPFAVDGATYQECSHAKRANPGTFTFTASAGTSFDCSQSSCSECLADGSGGCVSVGALVAGDEYFASTTVALDGSYGLWPRITSKELPAPIGGSSGVGAPRPISVELVFTE
jgi:hypothetical protein